MPRRTPQRTTIAAVGGLAGGTALGVTVGDDFHIDGEIGEIGGILLPIVCLTAFAMRGTRKWIANHDRHTQDAYAELAERHRRLDEEHAARTADLASREKRLTREAETRQAHIVSLAYHMGKMLCALGLERARRTDLQEKYEDLASDYNAMVQRTMQERADRFTGRIVIPRPGSSPWLGRPFPASERHTEQEPPADGTRGHIRP